MTEENRITLTEDQLASRLVELEKQIEVLKSDVKAVKKDASFHKDDNPKGIAKDDVKRIHNSAKLFVKDNFFEKRAEALATFAKFEELNPDYN
jgi:outer membrane murein-binding lipoprotein Lpp